MIELYWNIGRSIVIKQATEKWGNKVIETLAADLQRELPGLRGYSSRNIWRMRAFYVEYPEGEILPQHVAEIPWGHNILLIEKIKDIGQRFWYAKNTMEYGWSRPVLWHQIESGLYERQAIPKKATNFANTLPPLQSELATEILKNKYNFDFLMLAGEYKERNLHLGLMAHLQKFLVELGVGFSFVGSQYPIMVGKDTYYIDCLFYHLKLRAFIVCELKIKEFKAEHAGKLNFYLTAVNRQLKHPTDNPSIGLILCKNKDDITVEYALHSSHHPIGVAEYELVKCLPKEFQNTLPSTEQLEGELSNVEVVDNPYKDSV
jgi:predicted nuclease of restriction endonuclease-like (RecB) superfamily